MDQRFTRTEVERMTGATRQQLDYWSRLGLVHPRARWGERFFSFADLVAVETLSRLVARHIPVRRLCRAMDALERQLGRTRSPLSSLRVLSNGTKIVVHEPGPTGKPIEPLSGQFVLDFETKPLERKVSALGERTAEEWFELGMAWDANESTLQQAADAYRHAIDRSPEWVEARINLGTTLYQLNRLEESRAAFAAAVEIDPANALARFNFGCLCDRLADTTAAIAEFRAAVSLVPHMADAHLNLALAYEKTGHKADALHHLSLYLRYDPQGSWAEFARTRIEASHRRVRRSGKVTPFRTARS